MRNSVTPGILLAVLGLAAPAKAADVITKAPPRAAPDFSWAGTYLGAIGSIGMAGSDLSDRGCVTACDAPDMARWGAAVGATVGHNLQSGSLVYGIEADASWARFKQSSTFEDLNAGNNSYSVTHRAEWDWYATLRGRLGLAADRTLVYVTGGVAFVGVDYSSRFTINSNTPVNNGYSFDGTQVGIAAGAGIEHAFAPDISLKAEYLYVGLPSVTRTFDVNGVHVPSQWMTWKSDAHLLRFGLNYRLGGPVVARY